MSPDGASKRQQTAGRRYKRSCRSCPLFLATVCLLVCLHEAHALILQEVIGTTKYGRVRGRRRLEMYDIGSAAITDTVDVYLGVPYAMPPVGELRFQHPRTLQPWPDIRDATKPGAVCPQVNYYSQTVPSKQDEDCLNLNIYVPFLQDDGETTYPVMLFVHGGSYEEGAGVRYDGFTLAQHGVIVITINYRLGELGYLTTGDDRLPGNYGLLDQIHALRWIPENIGNFRGDASRITVFGSSAGSTSVGLLMFSPGAKGMFHRAILQSGPPSSFWTVYNSTVNHARFVRAVAKEVGCADERMSAILKCLKQTNFNSFIAAHWKLPRIVPSHLNFKPRVDGRTLPNFPETMFEHGHFERLPVMMGVVEDEWARSMGWFFRDLKKWEVDSDFSDGFDRASFEKSVAHVITQRFWWPKQVADVIIHAYTDWSNRTDPLANRFQYKEFMSDLTMVAPTIQFAHTLVGQGVPVHLYRFNKHSQHTEERWWGCYHSLELDFVFGSPFNGYDIATDRAQNYSESDRRISRVIMKLWTDFAKHGTPSRDNNVSWEPMTSSKSDYLYISDEEITMKTNYKADKVQLWADLVPKLLPQSPWQRASTECMAVTIDYRYKMMCWVFVAVAVFFLLTLVTVVAKHYQMTRNIQQRRYYDGRPRML